MPTCTNHYTSMSSRPIHTIARAEFPNSSGTMNLDPW